MRFQAKTLTNDESNKVRVRYLLSTKNSDEAKKMRLLHRMQHNDAGERGYSINGFPGKKLLTDWEKKYDSDGIRRDVKYEREELDD